MKLSDRRSRLRLGCSICVAADVQMWSCSGCSAATQLDLPAGPSRIFRNNVINDIIARSLSSVNIPASKVVHTTAIKHKKTIVHDLLQHSDVSVALRLGFAYPESGYPDLSVNFMAAKNPDILK